MPRRRLASPKRACDYVRACVYDLFGIGFMARFLIVYGLLRGLCMIGLRVSLPDNVVTCLDVNMGALMYWHVEFIRENCHYMA